MHEDRSRHQCLLLRVESIPFPGMKEREDRQTMGKPQPGREAILPVGCIPETGWDAEEGPSGASIGLAP